MAFNQPNLFSEDQDDLFGAAPAQSAYQVNPQHIRNRFIEFLDLMQKAEVWPWDEGHVETLKELTWPYLFAKMPDQAEAVAWKAKIEAEATRLDVASKKAA